MKKRFLFGFTQRMGISAAFGRRLSSPTSFRALCVTLGLGLLPLLSLGQNWTAHFVPEEDDQEPAPDGSVWAFEAVASSADGERLVASACCPGPIFTSADAGVTWNATTAPLGVWTSVASSTDGQALLALNRGGNLPLAAGIFFSAKAGATWTGPIAAPVPVEWGAVASSSDGRALAAVGRAVGRWNSVATLLSTNAGVSWRFTQGVLPTTNLWRRLTVSGDGNRWIINGVDLTAGPNFNGVALYRSDDSGTTWHRSPISGSGVTAIAASANGEKLVATDAAAGIFTSADGGTSWVKRNTPANPGWAAVATSADGSRLLAASSAPRGQIYVSTDSGATWRADYDPPAVEFPVRQEGGIGWRALASSADGLLLVGAPAYFGGFYTLDLRSPLRVTFEIRPSQEPTNQFSLCDDFQVIATVSNTSAVAITGVVPVSPPTNGVQGVVRSLAAASPGTPQTIRPNGVTTFTWPFRAARVGQAVLKGQFRGTMGPVPLAAEGTAPFPITVVRPNLVVNMSSDESAIDPSDGCADVDSSKPGRQTTLRAAIETANSIANRDVINFDLPLNPAPPDGPVIRLTKPLPPMSDGGEIRGRSQPKGGRVGISGRTYSSSRPDSAALELRGDVTINGLCFHDFSASHPSAIVWLRSGHNTVQASRFGWKANGEPSGNGALGIRISASGQQIGGIGPNDGNEFRSSGPPGPFGDSPPGVGILVTNGPAGEPTRDVAIEGNRFGSFDGRGFSRNGPANAVILWNAAACRVGGTVPTARNYFSGSLYSAVFIFGAQASENEVVGNWFGLGLDGFQVDVSQWNGFGIALAGGAHHNRIGGSSPSSRNLISSGEQAGVVIAFDAHDNSVEGNWIGLAADGASPAGNEVGVAIWDGANNRIGGTSPGQRNIIARNLAVGVLVGRPENLKFKKPSDDPSPRVAAGTVIQGNWIGLDASGLRPAPNGATFRIKDGAGVLLSHSATGTLVGSATAGARNVISGNLGQGILVDAASGTAHVIQGNRIGFSGDGAIPVPNSKEGISVVGEPVVVIGGLGSGQANTVANNAGPGINLSQMKPGVPGLPLDGNLVYNNFLPANILLSNPRTPNDSGDADQGPNGLQNWPLLVGAFNRNGATEVVLDLSSFAAAANIRIALLRYAGGGGDVLLATTNILTRSRPRDRYLVPVTVQPVGTQLTALATSSGGTSEFSPPLTVVSGLDSDGDGIPDALERRVPVDSPTTPRTSPGEFRSVPGEGDRNADGVMDELQPNVASAEIPETGRWITVAAPPGRSLSEVVGLRPRDVTALGATSRVWPGAVHFVLSGGTGSSESIQLWYPSQSEAATVWIGTEAGWSPLTDAVFQTVGDLTSTSLKLPSRAPGSAWMLALGRRLPASPPLSLAVGPLVPRRIGLNPNSKLLGFRGDGTDQPLATEGLVVPMRIPLPDTTEDWQLEVSEDLRIWSPVDVHPAVDAEHLDLQWSEDPDARFFRWMPAFN
ncbi:MAG: hypothetical protein JNL10_01220 [Verrucomicrobiales bacterium]|nr:hypothetical protein [Verrucomicrobiales bacterium]